MRDIAAAKSSLRRTAKAARAAIPVAERAAAAARLADFADLAAGGSPPAVVAGFMPFGAEIDPGPLLRALAARGARLALPRIEGDDLTFRLHAAGDPLIPGPWGIAEPAAGAPLARPELILTPLLAFDRRGGRLGYGRGFYDRALRRHSAARALGVAFAAQETGEVPASPSDTPLDAVLTETGMIDCAAHRGQ